MFGGQLAIACQITHNVGKIVDRHQLYPKCLNSQLTWWCDSNMAGQAQERSIFRTYMALLR